MRLTCACRIRRFLNSPYDTFKPLPKADRWQKKERIWQWTAWCYGDERDKKAPAFRKRQQIWQYETEKREDEANYKKHFAIERAKIGLAEHGMEYKHFKPLLRKAKILLSEEVLSQLAMYEPRSFKSICLLTKQLALEDGRDGIDKRVMAQVTTRGQLSSGPFPSRIMYARGRADRFSKPPRLLRPEEF